LPVAKNGCRNAEYGSLAAFADGLPNACRSLTDWFSVCRRCVTFRYGRNPRLLVRHAYHLMMTEAALDWRRIFLLGNG